MEKLPLSISEHLESFVDSARQLESALNDEKKKSQKIAQEYLASRTTLENGVRELKKRLVSRDERIETITTAFKTLQAQAENAQKKLESVSARELIASTELDQFKKAWGEVLARETEARKIVMEFEKAKRTLNEQRNQILTLETALGEANRSYETTARDSTAKNQQLAERIEKVTVSEASLREELSQKERKLRAFYQGEVASEKVRIQNIARKHIESEVERVTLHERRANEVKILEITAEMKLQQNRMEDGEKSRHHEIERARARLLALTEESHQKTFQLDSLREEYQLLQRELMQVNNSIEGVKKESSKAILMEHLRHEAQTHELQSKIHHLLTDGLYAEKSPAPEGDVVIYESSVVSEKDDLSHLGSAREGGNASLRVYSS
ncbi:MAG: hypothetical protein H7301_11655 [Cryobacterium sp.]|nr:hypothetical protein [Oligoflexia bacterium]